MKTPVLAALLALPLAAHAEVWTDPSLAEALEKADLVVRAKAPPRGSKGAAVVAFTIDAVLKGEASGALHVIGLHDATRTSGATFGPGEQVLLILNKAEWTKDEAGPSNLYAVPTATFGRFPIRDDVVKFAALRDTILRLDIPLADYEAFLGLHLGADPDPKWIAGLRKDLLAGDGTADGAALARLYLALEAFALYGKPGDDEAIASYLDEKGPFQLRISAVRALARVLGTKAAPRLVVVAKQDEEAAVRTTAIGALGRLKPPPANLVQTLAALLPDATVDLIRFTGPNDPRLNKWPSPKEALVRVIGRHGAAPVKQALLDIIGDAAPPEVYGSTLRALITLKSDTSLPKELVRCFRAKGELSGALYNRELCGALTRLTGKRLGEDTDAWRRYVSEH